MEELTVTMWNDGFKPVIDKNSKVLILGSFPSVKSREQGFYYGHPQNRFWKVLAKALNQTEPKTISEKIQFLKTSKIAVWDVIEKSSISSSSDAEINLLNSVPINFNAVIENYPNVELIICNGKKAYELFIRFNSDCKIKCVCLPSTSPANARFDTAVWERTLKNFLI